MARNFNGRVELHVTTSYTQNPDIGEAGHEIDKIYLTKFTNGTGANQAQVIFSDSRSTAGNDDLDLAGGLTDALGNVLTFTSVKTIIVKAADANTTNVLIGAEGTNEFSSFFGDDTDKLVLPPGGVFMITNPGATGFGVTATTADKLRIAAASGTVAFEVILIGEGA